MFVSVSLAAVAAADVERYKQVRAIFLESGDGVHNVAASNCSLSPEAPCFVEHNFKGKQAMAPITDGQSVGNSSQPTLIIIELTLPGWVAEIASEVFRSLGMLLTRKLTCEAY